MARQYKVIDNIALEDGLLRSDAIQDAKEEQHKEIELIIFMRQKGERPQL